MEKYLWILFLGLAINYMFKSTQKNKILNGKNVTKLTCVVVDNKIGTLGNGITVYYPIYEYELDDVVKQYTSKCNQFKPMVIGTQSVLCYDKTNNQIIETAESVTQMMLGVMFAGAALILMFFAN